MGQKTNLNGYSNENVRLTKRKWLTLPKCQIKGYAYIQLRPSMKIIVVSSYLTHFLCRIIWEMLLNVAATFGASQQQQQLQLRVQLQQWKLNL